MYAVCRARFAVTLAATRVLPAALLHIIRNFMATIVAIITATLP
jgi:hypothetical protein